MSDAAEVQRALGSFDPEERRRAVARIAALPPSSRVSPLLSALGDGDWRVRKEAIGLTAQLGPEPDMLQALAKVFEPGDNVGLRNAAVEALGGFGGFAVDALAPCVASLDADGKKLAVETLGRSGAPAALELLAPLVTDADPNVRVAALEAVGAVGASRVEAARVLLTGRISGTDPIETLAALESL
ncbi:MAG TPA: HEAT repeat domain-containing protein, partial [Polyangiaceae bacterium]|nr:HEAT repeat domain-containing protein [Polyangiaceae bacterium]